MTPLPFITVMRKDLRIIFRDKTALAFIFGLPLVFALMFSLIYSGRGAGGKMPQVKVLVVNNDTGRHGGDLVEAMRQVGLIVVATQDATKMAHRVRTGEQSIGVEIPADFSKGLEDAVAHAGDPNAPQAKLRVFVDPAQTTFLPLVQGSLYGAAQRVTSSLFGAAFGSKTPPKPAVSLDISTQAEKKGSGGEPTIGDRVMPGLMIYFVFFMANGVAVTLIVERQEGTLRRMLSAPITPGQILLGKLLARSIVGGFQLLMLVAIGKFTMDMTLTKSPVGMILIAVICLFAASGLGLLIATFGKTQEQIQGMTTLALLMMGLLSGCLFPREILPEMMQKLSYITPHAWALTAMQDLLLRNMTLVAALPSIFVTLLFGLGFFGLALVRFRYE